MKHHQLQIIAASLLALGLASCSRQASQPSQTSQPSQSESPAAPTSTPSPTTRSILVNPTPAPEIYVRTGDTLEFLPQGSTTYYVYFPGQSPCSAPSLRVGTGGGSCVVQPGRQGRHPYFFSPDPPPSGGGRLIPFNATGCRYCYIVVDPAPGPSAAAPPPASAPAEQSAVVPHAAGAAATQPPVESFSVLADCDESKKAVLEYPPSTAAVGDRMSWNIAAGFSGLKVTPSRGMCSQGATFGSGEVCTLKSASTTPYTIKVEIEGCTPGSAKLTVTRPNTSTSH